MPRVPDEFPRCVVYLYGSEEDAINDSQSGGSGFLVEQPSVVPGMAFGYVVTNSHVAVRARCVRLNAADGGVRTISIGEADWIHHAAGDDLAIAPLTTATVLPHLYLPRHYILTEQEFMEFNVGVGDDVFFMGRFVSHQGVQRNSPVVRWGTIAKMAGEPVAQPERGFAQDSLLIEARSLSGFSGSPVMLYIAPFSNRFRSGGFAPDEGLDTSTTTGLIGIDWGHLGLAEDQAQNSGIMAVVPSWKLLELLDQPESVEHRESQEATLAERRDDTV